MRDSALRQLVKQAHGIKETKALPVDDEAKVHENWLLPKRREWYSRPERERLFTAESLEFARAVLAGEFAHERRGRLSPSNIGQECERELLFSFANAPQELRAPANVDKMESGSFEHLRWQMAGLSAGYLVECEYWCHSEDLRMGGSVDGVCADGSLLEFKNTAPHIYKGLEGNGSAAEYAAKMHAKYLLQIEAYFLVDSVQPEPKLNGWASLVYQDRDSKDTKEYRVTSSPNRRKELEQIVHSAHEWIDIDSLPDMLEGCARASSGESASPKEVKRYRDCPYRDWCPTATTVMGAR